MFVFHLGSNAEFAAMQPVDDVSFVESRSPETRGWRQRNDRKTIIDLHRVVFVRDFMERRDPAEHAKKLPGGADLKWADGQEQGRVRFLRAPNCVLDVQGRGFAGAGREGRDLEANWIGAPRDGGNRQVAFRQRLRRLHVVPRDQAAANVEEWLDRVAAFLRFDDAVFAEQRLVRVAVDADNGPVRLFVVEVTR